MMRTYSCNLQNVKINLKYFLFCDFRVAENLIKGQLSWIWRAGLIGKKSYSPIIYKLADIIPMYREVLELICAFEGFKSLS